MRNDSIDNLRLDINRERVKSAIYTRQGDTKTRTIHCTLADNGNVIDLSDVIVAEIFIKKTDGTECDNGVVISGNELQYTLRTNDVAAVGENICQFMLTFSDGAILSSPTFSLFVYQKELDQTTQTSTNEYTSITQQVVLANQYATTASAAATTSTEAKTYIEGAYNSIREMEQNVLAVDSNISNDVYSYIDANKELLKGADGKDGKDGKDGANGTNGKDGVDGANGTNGTDGSDGKDAFVYSTTEPSNLEDGQIWINPNGEVPTLSATEVLYDNTTSGLSSTNVQDAIDEIDSNMVNTSDSRLSDSRPANGGNSTTVNGHTVNSDVPSGAVFTDTNTWRPLGTGSTDACAGNDSRLSNSRPASDVYSWAKASAKPTYTYSEVGAAASSHTHNSVKTRSGSNAISFNWGSDNKLGIYIDGTLVRTI